MDGTALARLLGLSCADRPGRLRAAVLLRATLPNDAARAAACQRRPPRRSGRGIAGLVNAIDPALVTLGGGAAELLTAAPEELATACRDGMMRIRRSAPPPVVRAGLGDGGPLVGAAERVWDRCWQQLRH